MYVVSIVLVETILTSIRSGVMIPIPQYPLYSATVALKKAHQVDYFLDEENGWSMNMDHLKDSLETARAKGINVNGFILINPGNPTGRVLSREAMHNVVEFCANNQLVLLSDEVYQDNVYDGEFVSAKRAAYETGLLEQDAIELVSFHSTSKGLFGECGYRGGYMEVVGMDKRVESHLYKLASSALCPNLNGQIMVDLMVRGPKKGTPSYDSHCQQKKEIFESLKRRAKLVTDGLNEIPGFSCQAAQGSMYCFPSIELPNAALEEAKRQNMDPDTFYALSLLESTGICVVPASGFGQREGRHGFRTTFLPSEQEMKRAVDLFRQHHEEFCARYDQ
jgi:alanine transaminase